MGTMPAAKNIAVEAGPTEATAVGNILVQAVAACSHKLARIRKSNSRNYSMTRQSSI